MRVPERERFRVRTCPSGRPRLSPLVRAVLLEKMASLGDAWRVSPEAAMTAFAFCFPSWIGLCDDAGLEMPFR